MSPIQRKGKRGLTRGSEMWLLRDGDSVEPGVREAIQSIVSNQEAF